MRDAEETELPDACGVHADAVVAKRDPDRRGRRVAPATRHDVHVTHREAESSIERERPRPKARVVYLGSSCHRPALGSKRTRLCDAFPPPVSA